MRSVILLFLTFVPSVVFAADTGFWGAVVPACAYTLGDPCQACDLVQLAENILKVMISLAVVASAIMFAYAGFLYITAAASPNNIDTAKSIFWKILIGLIFVLAAYIIVDMVMRVFVKQPLNVLTNIRCVTPVYRDGRMEFPTLPGTESESPETPRDTTPQPGTVSPNELSHDEAKKRLEEAGITVTSTTGAKGVSATCSGVGCTNLTGMREDTVAQLIELKKACGCDVVVTGATETGAGHYDGGGYSHAEGYKADIAFSPKTDEYIQKNYTYIGYRGGAHGGPQYRDKCGNIYTKEIAYNHWDIQVTSKCGG